MNKRLTKISKYMSFILKHHPESIGVKPDGDGWLEIESFVAAAAASGKSITIEQVHAVIDTSEEARFQRSDDRLKVRAL
ncbi:MAG: RNA 2'-phosphotransferase [Pirellulaceae bacterium]